jgi:hypothetical protein
MSFDVVNFSLAAAVADAGTVTVGYPTDRSKGHYDWSSAKHTLTMNGNLYSAPADFTLTFNANASSITLTNASGTTWPASASCRLGLERAGRNGFDALIPADTQKVREISTGLFLIDLGSPNVLDADGIAASQSVTVGTTPLASLNGALASGGTVTLDVPRNVVAAWTGTAILTVTGKDEYNATIVEKSASGTSLTGKKAFKKITSCSFSADVTGATIGTGDVLGLPVALQSASQIIAEYQSGALLARAAGKVFIPFEIEATELAAGTAENIVCPVAGHIYGIRGVVQEAVTTGGAVTVEVNTVAVTGLTFTVANSDAAGTRYSDTPTTWHDATAVVAAGDRITVTPAAAFATAGALNGVIEIDVSTAGQLNGTVVSAVNSEATATTGDVRGTYDPLNACDGSIGIKLLVALTDGDNKGVAQYAG